MYVSNWRRILLIARVALIASGLWSPLQPALPRQPDYCPYDRLRHSTVDGSAIRLDAAPFIAGGRTMLPVRFVAENMGAGVSFVTQANGAVTKVNLGLPQGSTSTKTLVLSLSSATALVNGQAVALDATPVIRGGRTFVPARFISEQMGATVAWNGTTRTVTITMPVVSIDVPGKLSGAGATFPLPLYTKMFDVYNSSTRVRVNYQGIGSGGGIKALTDKTVDFGASDAFLTVRDNGQGGSRPAHSHLLVLTSSPQS